MNQWYVIQNGQPHGPYSPTELREMASTGKLQPDDRLFKDGISPKKASKIQGLFPTPPPPASSDNTAAARAAIPPIPPSLQALKSQATDGLRDGLGIAQDVVRQGVSTLRTSFGASFAAATKTASIALTTLLQHPIKYTFSFLVFVTACSVSMPGLLTLVLIPVFVMGYIQYTHDLIEAKPASFRVFISFMRHGWDSLWHLLMLLAAFFILFALMISPAVIVSGVLYFGGGTLVLVGSDLTPDSSSGADYDERWSNGPSNSSDYSPPSKGIVTSLGNAVMELGEAAFHLVVLVFTLVVATILLTPLVSAAILVFTIALDLIGRSPTEAKFDFVYESFGDILRLVGQQWKRLLCSGVVLSCVFTGGVGMAMLLRDVLTGLSLDGLAAWVVVIVLPLALFAFLVYTSIYCVQTASALLSSMTRAPESNSPQ